MRRAWINQPSTSQLLHHMHGTLALAGPYSDTCDVVYLLSGETISMVVPKFALSDGWPEHLQTKWKPTDSEPEEGDFLVYMPTERDKSRMQVCNKRKNITVIGGKFDFDCRPRTHWATLPEEPK